MNPEGPLGPPFGVGDASYKFLRRNDRLFFVGAVPDREPMNPEGPFGPPFGVGDASYKFLRRNDRLFFCRSGP